MKIKISVISIFKMGVGSGEEPPPQVFNIILQLITSRCDGCDYSPHRATPDSTGPATGWK